MASNLFAFVITILANVPFVGHVESGRLFCNDACEVVETGFRTDGPVDMPYEGEGLTVRQLP